MYSLNGTWQHLFEHEQLREQLHIVKPNNYMLIVSYIWLLVKVTSPLRLAYISYLEKFKAVKAAFNYLMKPNMEWDVCFWSFSSLLLLKTTEKVPNFLLLTAPSPQSEIPDVYYYLALLTVSSFFFLFTAAFLVWVQTNFRKRILQHI